MTGLARWWRLLLRRPVERERTWQSCCDCGWSSPVGGLVEAGDAMHGHASSVSGPHAMFLREVLPGSWWADCECGWNCAAGPPGSRTEVAHAVAGHALRSRAPGSHRTSGYLVR